MTLYPTFIAGLFDSPWVVIAILVASGIANWLAQRRTQKADENPTPDAETTPPAAPPVVASWQEKLRKLMEETQAAATRPDPPASGPPPLLRRSAPPEVVIVPPVIPAGETYSAPRLRPSPVAVVGPDEIQFRRPARPAWAATSESTRPLVTLARVATQPRGKIQRVLRHPDTARQAFVASLVFGPPKGLES